MTDTHHPPTPPAQTDADLLAAEIERDMKSVVERIRLWHSLVGRRQVDVGLGSNPAIVVIDLARFWTEQGYEAYSPSSEAVIPQVSSLLSHARAANVPVVFTTQAYQSTERSLVSATGMARKFPGSSALREGSTPTELHAALSVEEGEHLLTKTQSSAFAHTHLASMLHHAGVDTVIVTGVVTSGCVRATAADSLANGFRTILVPECVSDVMPGATAWTLFDVTTKIGDVVPLAQIERYLDELAAERGLPLG